ncbi:unnamed protein product [Orchesella dallaii]|uniref:Uncharacterized protein n=1 Tax=Orchesella dallaii TaxID=48710 RepID=A0ABP1RGZ0_9HEXA
MDNWDQQVMNSPAGGNIVCGELHEQAEQQDISQQMQDGHNQMQGPQQQMGPPPQQRWTPTSTANGSRSPTRKGMQFAPQQMPPPQQQQLPMPQSQQMQEHAAPPSAAAKLISFD